MYNPIEVFTGKLTKIGLYPFPHQRGVGSVVETQIWLDKARG